MMKKTALFLALLAGLGSLAFYSKNTPPTRYMTVIGTSRAGGIGSTISEVVSIGADGVPQLKQVDTRNVKSNTAAMLLLHRAEVMYLNELGAEGWHVISVATSGSLQSGAVETTYFLEHQAGN